MKKSAVFQSEFFGVWMKSPEWLQRLELVALVTVAVEKANFTFAEIIIPTLSGNPPAEWWTEDNDRCLICETWKCGFGKYALLNGDGEISSTCASFTATGPLGTRLKQLAGGIQRHYFVVPKPYEVELPWSATDKVKVIRRMFHGGVPLSQDGSYNWTTFREICGLQHKPAKQCERAVRSMMEVPVGDGQDPDLNDDNDDADLATAIGAARITDLPERIKRGIKARVISLTKLRCLFLKFTDEQIDEYFALVPRDDNLPQRWTNHLEFVFFNVICACGWGVCREILRMRIFDGVFDGDPPECLSHDMPTIRRLNFITDFISQNILEVPREKDPRRLKITEKPHVSNVPRDPGIRCNGNGAPVFPIHLTPTSYVIDLGHIVSDRPGFHNERFIYPAGFKSSRLHTSTLDPLCKVRYTSEILDTGREMPLFRVTMDDHPEISFEGNSPNSPWNLLGKTVLERYGSDRPPHYTSDGQMMYGLRSRTISRLIQDLEGSEKCVRYIRKQFETPGSRELEKTEDEKTTVP
jgi:chromodomain-helicase-DNA-binding protein 7